MRQFGIFAKYWRPGNVKTRLAVSVGDELAADLHRVSVEILLARFGNVADRHVLSVWPPEDSHRFRAVIPSSWELTAQVDGDLGTKMAGYFAAAFAAGATQAVLIGADSPMMPRDVPEQAFKALDHDPVVIGPSDDGGYYVIGCRAPLPPIFADIAWSTPDVWSQTTMALQKAHCAFRELPICFDIDRLDDVRRLESLLRSVGFLDPIWNELRGICAACLRSDSGK